MKCCFCYCCWFHKPTYKVWLILSQEQLRYWWHWVCGGVEDTDYVVRSQSLCGGGGIKSFSCQTLLLSWVLVEVGLWQLKIWRTPDLQHFSNLEYSGFCNFAWKNENLECSRLEILLRREIQKITSQAEQGHTRVSSSPCSNWTQSIQQSNNLLDLFC